MDLLGRKQIENWEKDNLYRHALKSGLGGHTKRRYTSKNCKHFKDHKGRCVYCDVCPFRTEFQRDADRILHSRAFRRLMHKTQVFIQPPNEDFRTRLSHTLEVVQISKAIARALKLNEVATEAIALGHDLGHTPFGHAGEDALRECMLSYAANLNKTSEEKEKEKETLSGDNNFLKGTNGFEHNEQSVRVVDLLEDHYYPKKEGEEKYYEEGKGFFGLNLTYKVREGIYTHTTFKKEDYNFCRKGRYDEKFKPGDRNRSLEAQVVDIADGLAYTCHDLEDAMNFGILKKSDIPRKGEMQNLFNGKKTHDRLRLLTNDVIEESKKELNKIEGEKDVNLSGRIKYSKKYQEIMEGKDGFKKLYREKIYQHPYIDKKTEKAKEYIKVLFETFVKYYAQSSGRIPLYLSQKDIIALNCNEKVALAACDETASLTDNQAIYYFKGLNSPESFKGWTGWFGEFVPSHG